MAHRFPQELIDRVLELRKTETITATAKAVGITFDQVRNITRVHANPNDLHGRGVFQGQEPTIDELSRQQREDAKRAHQERLFKELLQQRSTTDTIIEGIVEAIPRVPWMDVPKLEAPSLGSGSPQTALLMLSDLHIGSVARPEDTGGYGDYSYEIFRRRLDNLRAAVRSITHRERHFGKIETLLCALLGDLIDNTSIFPSQQQFIELDLSQQFLAAVDDLSDFLVGMLDIFDRIFVPSVSGNHGRIGRKGENAHWINWDYLVAHMIKRRLENYSQIQFEIPKTPFCVVEVEGYRILLRHGDSIKSWAGIPWYGLQRSAGRWANIQAASNQSIQFMLSGHLHQAASVPYTGMEAIINGSFIGTNEYSLELESLNEPSQWFMMVHPKFGMSARYKIDLDADRS